MSERTLFLLALLAAGAARPALGQELEQLRRREAELEQRLAHLQATSALADSTRFATQERRIVIEAPLHVAIPDWIPAAEVRGLDEVVTTLRARLGSALGTFLTDTLVIGLEPGGTIAEWRLGPLSGGATVGGTAGRMPGWLPFVARTALDRWAAGLPDPRFTAWRGVTNTTISPAELRDGSVRDLILSPSARGPRCAEGEIQECRLLLELGAGDAPRIDAYAPADLVKLVEYYRGQRTVPGTMRCISAHDLAACRDLLVRQGAEPQRAATGRVRHSLVEFALATGGDAAWQRLVNAAGRPLDAQLAAAAGIPIDTLLARWQHDLRTQRRTTDAGLGPNLLLALGWLVAGALLFAWRYRWRSV